MEEEHGWIAARFALFYRKQRVASMIAWGIAYEFRVVLL
jgi:hypothetical protein